MYSVGKTVGNSNGQSTRHRTDLLFKSLGDSVGIFNGAPVTSPVRIWHFKSVGNSVGMFDGEQVPSRVWAQVLIPSENPSVKSPYVRNSVRTLILILNFRSVIQSVITDRISPSVITDRITDRKFRINEKRAGRWRRGFGG